MFKFSTNPGTSTIAPRTNCRDCFVLRNRRLLSLSTPPKPNFRRPETSGVPLMKVPISEIPGLAQRCRETTTSRYLCYFRFPRRIITCVSGGTRRGGRITNRVSFRVSPFARRRGKPPTRWQTRAAGCSAPGSGRGGRLVLTISVSLGPCSGPFMVPRRRWRRLTRPIKLLTITCSSKNAVPHGTTWTLRPTGCRSEPCSLHWSRTKWAHFPVRWRLPFSENLAAGLYGLGRL